MALRCRCGDKITPTKARADHYPSCPFNPFPALVLMDRTKSERALPAPPRPPPTGSAAPQLGYGPVQGSHTSSLSGSTSDPLHRRVRAHCCILLPLRSPASTSLYSTEKCSGNRPAWVPGVEASNPHLPFGGAVSLCEFTEPPVVTRLGVKTRAPIRGNTSDCGVSDSARGDTPGRILVAEPRFFTQCVFPRTEPARPHSRPCFPPRI